MTQLASVILMKIEEESFDPIDSPCNSQECSLNKTKMGGREVNKESVSKNYKEAGIKENSAWGGWSFIENLLEFL